jgi:hypothetical protein
VYGENTLRTRDSNGAAKMLSEVSDVKENVRGRTPSTGQSRAATNPLPPQTFRISVTLPVPRVPAFPASAD